MSTYRGPRGEAPVNGTQESTTRDKPLASVASRAVSIRPHLGYQEDPAVAAEFDRIYQCTVQYTGDDHTTSQFAQAADVDPTFTTRANPDLYRELAEAQQEDSRLCQQRRRPPLEASKEDFGELPESSWQEVQKPEDVYAFHDCPDVNTSDSKHDDTILDAQWSVLGHTPRKNDCECVPELRTMPPTIAPVIIHDIPTDMTRVLQVDYVACVGEQI
ncbi:hypothetical protein L211DRAFT_850360 [Terfezia boudieri ATCC MYA-4762]|uniref:Uncharacterized protein n=1 Tax=Terfezia boudieri ATCC MYA-4762 TaxID=1051890 RepID=A0A3N4LNR7_9PEZI|nr:hypothetical protein L211DRAFT_850360 [Terfezia boudieri ATCC MYA-4762]